MLQCHAAQEHVVHTTTKLPHAAQSPRQSHLHRGQHAQHGCPRLAGTQTVQVGQKAVALPVHSQQELLNLHRGGRGVVGCSTCRQTASWATAVPATRSRCAWHDHIKLAGELAESFSIRNTLPSHTESATQYVHTFSGL